MDYSDRFMQYTGALRDTIVFNDGQEVGRSLIRDNLDMLLMMNTEDLRDPIEILRQRELQRLYSQFNLNMMLLRYQYPEEVDEMLTTFLSGLDAGMIVEVIRIYNELIIDNDLRDAEILYNWGQRFMIHNEYNYLYNFDQFIGDLEPTMEQLESLSQAHAYWIGSVIAGIEVLYPELSVWDIRRILEHNAPIIRSIFNRIRMSDSEATEERFQSLGRSYIDEIYKSHERAKYYWGGHRDTNQLYANRVECGTTGTEPVCIPIDTYDRAYDYVKRL